MSATGAATPWAVLGLPEGTTERAEIRKAYAALLRVHRPEEDPAGFRRIRDAYEVLLAYVDRAQREQGRGAGGAERSPPSRPSRADPEPVAAGPAPVAPPPATPPSPVPADPPFARRGDAPPQPGAGSERAPAPDVPGTSHRLIEEPLAGFDAVPATTGSVAVLLVALAAAVRSRWPEERERALATALPAALAACVDGELEPAELIAALDATTNPATRGAVAAQMPVEDVLRLAAQGHADLLVWTFRAAADADDFATLRTLAGALASRAKEIAAGAGGHALAHAAAAVAIAAPAQARQIYDTAWAEAPATARAGIASDALELTLVVGARTERWTPAVRRVVHRLAWAEDPVLGSLPVAEAALRNAVHAEPRSSPIRAFVRLRAPGLLKARPVQPRARLPAASNQEGGFSWILAGLALVFVLNGAARSCRHTTYDGGVPPAWQAPSGPRADDLEILRRLSPQDAAELERLEARVRAKESLSFEEEQRMNRLRSRRTLRERLRELERLEAPGAR